MKRLMFATVLCAAQFVHAANAIWNRTDGGALDVDANWKDSTPPNGTDLARLFSEQSAPVTMPTLSSMNFGPTYFVSFVGMIDLGSKSKTISATEIHVGCSSPEGSAAPELVAGTITSSGRLFFDGSGSSLTLNGVNAELRTSDAQIGIGRRNCALNVLGGAKYSGANIYVGYSRNAISNSLVVSGSGSRCTASVAVHVGSGASNCVIRVLDGGTLTAGSSISLGRECETGAEPQPGNLLVVSNATVSTSGTGSLLVGHDSSSNRVEILDRGNVSVAGVMSIGNDKFSSYASSWRSYGNSVAVMGVGSRISVSGEVRVGRQYAVDSSFTLADGATAEFNGGDVWVGREVTAPGSRFTVDNAVFDYAPASEHSFRVGYAARDSVLAVVNGGRFYATNTTATLLMGGNELVSASNGMIRVASGGVLSARKLDIGNVAAGGIEVENGEVEFSGNLNLQQYACLSLKGTNSFVHAGRIDVICPAGKSTFRVHIPPEGLTGNRSLIHTDYFAANSIASTQLICVDVAAPSDSVLEKRTYVIFKRDDGSWTANSIKNRTVLTGYDRVELSFDDESGEIRLTVKPKKKGLCLIYK